MTALHFLLEHGLADVAHVPDQKGTVSEQMMQAGESWQLNLGTRQRDMDSVCPSRHSSTGPFMFNASHLNSKQSRHDLGHPFAISNMSKLYTTGSCSFTRHYLHANWCFLVSAWAIYSLNDTELHVHLSMLCRRCFGEWPRQEPVSAHAAAV